jgi:NACalpha-BTF3-like transcription factor
MTADPLLDVADRLYAESLARFTEARDAAAKAAVTGPDADKELAGRIKALKKPSVAAWAVNLLVRRESDQIDRVLVLGESLRSAAESMSGDDLRTLTRQRRQLTTALAGTTRDLAREHEVRLTDAVVDQVEGMLTAAMLDPLAAQVLRSGLVLTAFTSTGVSELDVARICAVPAAVGGDAVHRASATERAAPSLRLVPEDVRVRREAGSELEQVEGTVGTLNARRLQLQGEIDELRRRLAALEDDVDAVDEDLEEAEAAREDAAAALEDAEGDLAAARQALDELG